MVFKGLIVLLAAGPVWGETLTVCEVLANLSSLSGKKIEVRGVWKRGDAAQFLEAERPCEQPTIRDGWLWADRINVIADQGKLSVAGYVAERSRLLERHGGHAKIIATLSGRIETREHFEIWTDAFGVQLPRGFARLVAQLRFWSATQLVAVPYSAAELERQASESDPQPKRVK